eukprot:TRINITY_DN17512_c0_g1_i2.p1 TRINITY_DN17512_c0_g1~~TRINITY_DN17512_c0_g1_i2.p1  ORF type:complete len:1283 (+),score=216.98 TRINITY_DN17512_c0_g1_i2:110-3958(+)
MDEPCSAAVRSRVLATFRRHDRAGDGYIDCNALVGTLKTLLNSTWSREEIVRFVSSLGAEDATSRVRYSDFVDRLWGIPCSAFCGDRSNLNVEMPTSGEGLEAEDLGLCSPANAFSPPSGEEEAWAAASSISPASLELVGEDPEQLGALSSSTSLTQRDRRPSVCASPIVGARTLPRTQEEMCAHFIPILKEKGIIVTKSGWRYARAAHLGEYVMTVINGEVVAKTVVMDETSMVIRQESADHELYVLEKHKFEKFYALPGLDIIPDGPLYDDLRDRGFRSFQRKGQLIVYQVTEEDMKFAPGGHFLTSFSSIPVPLRTGDYLVTVYPDATEIYMSRALTIYNDDGQLQRPKGVRTQEEMRAHFLSIMQERGVLMRRAGRRLARPAKRGETVLTIINTEVVAKTIVLDNTSMVIQEESADREKYVLGQLTFKANYETPGIELTEKGAEWEELRNRGFKYFNKANRMVRIYQVTEEDMQFVPSGKFLVPTSVIPQPLRAGDYLATGDKDADVIYLSRNAEEIYFSGDNLEVYYVFSSPLQAAPLSVDAELEGLRTSGAIVRLTCATRENLLLLKKAWIGRVAPSVLHISCHTVTAQEGNTISVVLEDTSGKPQFVSAPAFVDLVIGGGPAPDVVIISSCNSQGLAAACLERGVRRAVAVKHQKYLLDRAARDFASSFYGELRAHRSVETAFAVAIDSMRTSRDKGVPAEAGKLILLPENAPELHLSSTSQGQRLLSPGSFSLEPHVAVPLPFGAGEAGQMGALVQPRAAVPVVAAGGSFAASQAEMARSRQQFANQVLQAFAPGSYRVLKLSAPRGMGASHFAGFLSGFAAQPGGRLFSGGALVVGRGSEDGIPSQERMCEMFLPVIKSKGTLVKKAGVRLARAARKGEEVLTVVNGEVVGKATALDDSSMVIQQDTTDHELYLLSAEKFLTNYENPGKDITEQGKEFDTLRQRGFRYYERKGMVLIYRVTEDDMRLVPAGKFGVSFSSTPQPLQTGDYLVTRFPECDEVYMTRNAEQIYSSQVVRSQEEMLTHFLPQITQQGTLVRRTGAWLARPGRRGEEIVTIVGGEVTAKTLVDNDSSMVVQADSCDGEWYVLSSNEFAKSYELPGRELEENGSIVETLRARGFRYYKRKGWARIYRLRNHDLQRLPSGRFWGRHGESQAARAGDHLVCDYPDSKEVYVSRNAEQVFEPVPAHEIVRSQGEMCEQFLPILKLKGVRMRKTGSCAVRPGRQGETIRTIVDGEILAKKHISDDLAVSGKAHAMTWLVTRGWLRKRRRGHDL